MKRFLIPLLFVGALTLLPDSADARGYSRSRFDFTFGFSSGYHSYGGFGLGLGYNRFGYSRPYFSRGYYAPAFRSRFYYEAPIYYAPAPVVIVEPSPCYDYPRRSYYYRDNYCAPRYYRQERVYYYER